MRSAADIKNSIKAIEQTSQITNAMKLISTSKMQQAIQRYEANSLHFRRVRSTIKDILLHTRESEHVFLQDHQEGFPAYIVIAADKGLAGGYNSNILNYAMDLMRADESKYVVTIGQEARAFFTREKLPIDIEYLHIVQNPTLYEARNLVGDISGMFKDGMICEAHLVYTRYYSNIKQEPVSIKLLPVDTEALEDVQADEAFGSDYDQELSYHPSAKQVFDTLIPQYIIGLVYGALIQAFASENSARMVAMENASRNADDMMAKLNIQMNRVRQQAITSEISEIVSAMDVMIEEEL